MTDGARLPLVQLHAGFNGGTGGDPPENANADGVGTLWFPTTRTEKRESAERCATTSKHPIVATAVFGEDA